MVSWHLARRRIVVPGASWLTVMSVVLLSGCTSAVDDANSSSTAIAAVTPSQTPEGVPLGTTAPHDEDQGFSQEVFTQASGAALEAVVAFCRPYLSRREWIEGLDRLLSQTAAVAYETVDPAKVPCAAATGNARVLDGDGTFTIRVIVPTNAGDYSVYVHRPEVTDPWLVEQIRPMAGN